LGYVEADLNMCGATATLSQLCVFWSLQGYVVMQVREPLVARPAAGGVPAVPGLLAKAGIVKTRCSAHWSSYLIFERTGRVMLTNTGIEESTHHFVRRGFVKTRCSAHWSSYLIFERTGRVMLTNTEIEESTHHFVNFDLQTRYATN
jgi:hypothetical protein